MARLAPELFARYMANPLAMDASVCAHCLIPSNRYYTVSVWPIEGEVRIGHLQRTVSAVKISKSDSQ